LSWGQRQKADPGVWSSPGHPVHAGQEPDKDAQQRDGATEKNHPSAVVEEQVLPHFCASPLTGRCSDHGAREERKHIGARPNTPDCRRRWSRQQRPQSPDRCSVWDQPQHIRCEDQIVSPGSGMPMLSSPTITAIMPRSGLCRAGAESAGMRVHISAATRHNPAIKAQWHLPPYRRLGLFGIAREP